MEQSADFFSAVIEMIENVGFPNIYLTLSTLPHGSKVERCGRSSQSINCCIVSKISLVYLAEAYFVSAFLYLPYYSFYSTSFLVRSTFQFWVL